MIEALVTIVLSAIIGLGLTYTATQALKSQRYLNTQMQALAGMRNVLSTTGISSLCQGTASSVQIGTATQSTVLQLPQPSCATAAISVSAGSTASLSVDLPASSLPYTRMSLSTASGTDTKELFGGDGVLAVGF